MTIGQTTDEPRSFLWTQAAAIAFSYAHAIEDWFVGLFGTDRAVMTPSAAILLALEGLLYAAWAVALGLRAERAWMATAFVFTFGWALSANGLSILFCLPPCRALPPYGDIAHLGNLIFGAWASIVAWRELRRRGGFVWARQVVSAIVLLVVVNVISSVLASEFIASQR